MKLRTIVISQSILDGIFTAGLAFVILYLITLSSFVIGFLVIFISLMAIEELETHNLKGKLNKIALISASVAFISTILGINLVGFSILGALELTVITAIVIYVYEAYLR
jgi:hypothetical protein